MPLSAPRTAPSPSRTRVTSLRSGQDSSPDAAVDSRANARCDLSAMAWRCASAAAARSASVPGTGSLSRHRPLWYTNTDPSSQNTVRRPYGCSVAATTLRVLPLMCVSLDGARYGRRAVGRSCRQREVPDGIFGSRVLAHTRKHQSNGLPPPPIVLSPGR